jgi:hypothetical protein
MTGSSTQGIKTVPHPVSDLATAKATPPSPHTGGPARRPARRPAADRPVLLRRLRGRRSAHRACAGRRAAGHDLGTAVLRLRRRGAAAVDRHHQRLQPAERPHPAGRRGLRLLVFRGGPLELEQVGSADPPLGGHCLYGDRHRRFRRLGTEGACRLGVLRAAAPARLAPVYRSVLVRAAVCHQVAQRATHRWRQMTRVCSPRMSPLGC